MNLPHHRDWDWTCFIRLYQISPVRNTSWKLSECQINRHIYCISCLLRMEINCFIQSTSLVILTHYLWGMQKMCMKLTSLCGILIPWIALRIQLHQINCLLRIRIFCLGQFSSCGISTHHLWGMQITCMKFKYLCENFNYTLVWIVKPNLVFEEIRCKYRFIRCWTRTNLILEIANQTALYDVHIRPVFSSNIPGDSKQDIMRTTVPYGECKLPKTHPCVEFRIATCGEYGMIDWFTHSWLVWAVAFVLRLL